MKIQLKSTKNDCLVVATAKNWDFLDQKLSTATKRSLKDFLKKGLLDASHGATLFIPALKGQNYLVIFCGKKLNREVYSKLLAKAYGALKATRVSNAVSYLHELEIDDADFGWALQANITAAHQAFYTFDEYKSKAAKKHPLKSLSFANLETTDKATLNRAMALADAFKLVKDLGNTPPNVCTPAYLADTAKEFSKDKKTKVTVLGEAQMKKLGMNTILAVGQASANESKMIAVEYKGGNAGDKPYVFVGKGISYDTGGYSLKPAGAMVGMQYDMCGAATVLGLMQYLIDTQAPINVVGIVASAENMIDGDSYKNNDVITSYSGKTIEVLNTDAEGRLALCDALTYAEEFNPEAVISLATLTGAVLITFGNIATALMSHNQDLADDILSAADKAFDRTWQLPLYEEYSAWLKGTVSDLTNIAGSNGRYAGTSVAAAFLAEFTSNYPWAHLDIAGTATKEKMSVSGGATGRPLGALVQFLEDKVER